MISYDIYPSLSGLLHSMIISRASHVAATHLVSFFFMAECVEKREPSSTAGGNVNWCGHEGKQYGGSLTH